MASCAEPASLARLVAPHLAKARARDPLLNMLCLESPPDSPPESDGSDDELQMAKATPQQSRHHHSQQGGGAARSPGQMQQSGSNQPAGQAQQQQQQRPTRIQFKPAADTGGASSTAASSSAAAAAAHVFRREEPPNPAAAATSSSAPVASGLTALLRGAGVAGGGEAGGADKASAGPKVRIRVFNTPPKGSKVAIDVAESASFVTVLRQVLAQVGGEHASTPASAYELLMADADGDMDDDVIPARSKPVVNFGSDFYMRKASAKLAAANAKTDPGDAEGSNGSGSASASAGGGPPSPPTTGARHGVMRVNLPREAFGQRLGKWVIKVPYRPDAALHEQMLEICKMPRVRLHPDHHVFTLPSGGPNEPLDMSRRLGEIDLPRTEAGEPEIKVERRVYGDEPPPRSVRDAPEGYRADSVADAYNDAYGSPGNSAAAEQAVAMRQAAGSIDQTLLLGGGAMLYKEYNVVKVNKRGVRQSRVIGLDNHKFRNMAPANAREDERAATSVRDGALKWFGLRQHDTGTKHPFFYMQDLIDAWLVSGHDPRAFCVVFRERDEQNSQKSGKRKEHHYEAESAHEAAEIVAKLTHVANSVLRATRTERIRET